MMSMISFESYHSLITFGTAFVTMIISGPFTGEVCPKVRKKKFECHIDILGNYDLKAHLLAP